MDNLGFLNEKDLNYSYKIGDKVEYMEEKAIIVNRHRFHKRIPRIGNNITYILYFPNLKDYRPIKEEKLDKYGKKRE